MVSGVIVGGWSYVVAAYVATAAALLAYSVSVVRRHRSERRAWLRWNKMGS
jgi:hypothetical protein